MSMCPPHRAEQKDEKEEGRVELAEQEARKDAAAGNQVCDISCPVGLNGGSVAGDPTRLLDLFLASHLHIPSVSRFGSYWGGYGT